LYLIFSLSNDQLRAILGKTQTDDEDSAMQMLKLWLFATLLGISQLGRASPGSTTLIGNEGCFDGKTAKSQFEKIEVGLFPAERHNTKLEAAFYIVPLILVIWVTAIAASSTTAVWGDEDFWDTAIYGQDDYYGKEDDVFIFEGLHQHKLPTTNRRVVLVYTFL
jgi:hypothetical protein